MITVARQGWKARSPKGYHSRKKDPKVITVHYIGANISASDPEIPRVRQIQDFHMDGRGWSDIAYSFLTGKSSAYVGRGKNRKNAADGGIYNNGSLSICVLVGTVHPPTQAHYATLQELIWTLVEEFPTIKKIRPHKRLKSTSCPGAHLSRKIADGYFTLHRPADQNAELRTILDDFLVKLKEIVNAV